MAKTYSMKGPDGKTYSIVGPDNADPEEVKAKIKSKYKAPTKKNIIQKLLPSDQDKPVSSQTQNFAKAMTMPGRATRALGVGVETALPSFRSGQDQGLKNVIPRMKAAFQPGFQPQPGEKLGAFAGGMADPINLAAGAVLPGSGIFRSIASGTVMAGGASLLDQASKGKINPRELSKDALFGTFGGALVHTMARLPGGYVKNAPKIFKAVTMGGVPERATSIFTANPGLEKAIPQAGQAAEELVESKSQDVMDLLKQYRQAASLYFDHAAGSVKANLTAAEKAASKPIPSTQIPGSIEGLKNQLKVAGPMLAKKTPQTEELTGALFKGLLHVRQSIDHWVDYANKSGVPEVSSVQQGGLKLLRKDVNTMIESLPGGEVLRDADGVVAAANDVFGKLQPKMKRVGEAVEFLKDTFTGKGPNAKEDLINLLALEKVTGKPVVNDLFKAMTMATFSTKLAGNRLSRTIAGASPFLISAMLRVAGLPFQGALPMSAALATASQSPKLLGMSIRGAQKFGPALKTMAKPSAVAFLDLIRQRRREQKGAQ